LVPSAAAFVTPGIYDQIDEEDKAQRQQDDDHWPILPDLLEVAGDLVEHHAAAIYTILAKNQD